MDEKYIAGFIDADGHISVRARVGARPDLLVVVAQKVMHREVVEAIQEKFGGHLSVRRIKDADHISLQMRGGPARKCLERLKKYMVLKRHHAEQMLDLVDASEVLHQQCEVLGVREKAKAIRAQGASRLPNFPSRKWLAGYFDGDGSFGVKVCGKTGYAYPVASILAAKNYVAGLVLLHGAFGGSVCGVGENAFWQLQLSQPSKVKKFLSYFAPHLQIKKAQAYFLLGCAEHNFRDGIKVRDTIKALNSQQHRLSDPASVAADYVRQVNFEVPKKPIGRPKGAKDLKPRAKRQSKPSLR